MTVREIVELVGGKSDSGHDTEITGAAGIKEAGPGDVTFLANTRYLPLLKETKASAVIVSPEMEVPSGMIAIRHESPSLAFARIMESMGPRPVVYLPGIHPSAVISERAKLGRDVSIQPHVVIEEDVVIGDNTVICSGAFIGKESKIGNGTYIHPGVVIRERITIGERCIVHSGAVIGCDGFGYATVKGIHHKIPQIGTVVLEDEVEIGANVTIDRARFGKTWIKKGTKIDNLVQIAHNVQIGENSIIVAQTGISGSTTVGKNVIFAGQSGVVGHVNIGDGAIIGGRAGVTKNVKAGQTVSGFPATSHAKARRLQALVNRLPKLYEKIAELEERIENSSAAIKGER